MLRGFPFNAIAVSVVRSDANPQAVLRALQDANGSEVVYVTGRRDDKDLVALTLDIYVIQEQNQWIHQTQEKSTAVPTSARKVSWAALKKLRTELLLAVGGNNRAQSHCKQCAELEEFLEHCFERPAVFNRSWDGVMVLNVNRVTYFINTLLRFARTMSQEDENNNASRPCKSHECITALLSAFLVPGAKKTE